MSYDHVQPEPGFRELFRGSSNRQALCVLSVIAWVASCDGNLSSPEEELLRRVAESNEENAVELSAAIEMAQAGRPEDLEVACRYLRSETSRGAKRLLAQLAITMAVQDGRLTVSENLVLQFLADLLGISPRAFNKLFEKTAGRLFPEAGDPSSPDWWARRDAGLEAVPPRGGWSSAAGSRGGPERVGPEPMTHIEALGVLGLDEGATPDAMKAAYRRLAKKRHPDRFAPLGKAAVTTATVAFERLHEAYALLSSRTSAPAVAAQPEPPPSAAPRSRSPISTPREPAKQEVGA